MLPGNLFSLVFLLVLALVVFGIVQFIVRQFEIAELKQSGVPVTATGTRIKHWTTTTPIGAPPHQMMTTTQHYAVKAVWQDPQSGIARRFRSDSIDWWTSQRYSPGAHITVLVDPRNPEHYYVDTAS